ncbi:MAG TPA: hypothetical protein VGS19_39015 [Streptosporangiaceae bacterium]|nr:hypothetical protein [Streptosporangiaceae bacterium]
MRMQRWVVALAVIAAALAGCSGHGRTHHRPSAGGPVSTGTHWIIAASAVGRLEQAAGPAFVAQYLDGPQTTILSPRVVPAALASWHVAFAYDTQSLAQIRAALSARPPRQVTMVLYDPEHWKFTPASEQASVGASAATAASLVHQAGLRLIVAPATNLAESRPGGTPLPQKFLGSSILAQVAHSADWVEVQAQGLEADPARYTAYVTAALSQIRRANPRATVYAGLSTGPSGQRVSASELLADISQTSRDVSGYWLNVPNQGQACPRCSSARPQVAIALLRRLGEGRGNA